MVKRIVIILSCGLLVAACGASGKPTGSRNSANSQALKFADCMRSHGVSNFPDPSSGGDFQIQAGSGVNPHSPAFKGAQAQCAKLLPRDSSSALESPPEQIIEQMLTVSRCMRARRVSGFPDPTLGPPPPAPQEFAIAIGRDGVSLLVPKTIDVSSPAFKQAAVRCRFGSLLGAGKETPAP